VGMVVAAVCHPFAGELGHRRLCRPAPPGGWPGAWSGFVLLNPCMPRRRAVPEPSPYFPSSRCFLNPLYIRIEESGAADVPDMASLAEKARALNGKENRPLPGWALKSMHWNTFARSEELGPDERTEAYVRERGRSRWLHVFCALASVTAAVAELA